MPGGLHVRRARASEPGTHHAFLANRLGSCCLLYTSRFQTTDLKKMTVSDGSGEGCWLFFETKTVNGIPVKLVDFASAGQDNSTYYSWLKVNHNMNYLPNVKGGNPVWNNSPDLPSYSVTTGNTDGGKVKIQKEKVAFGGSSSFTITTDKGYTLKDVTLNGKSLGVITSYDLTNIRQDYKAVSYTHLDVYKRQSHTVALALTFPLISTKFLNINKLLSDC